MSSLSKSGRRVRNTLTIFSLFFLITADLMKSPSLCWASGISQEEPYNIYWFHNKTDIVTSSQVRVRVFGSRPPMDKTWPCKGKSHSPQNLLDWPSSETSLISQVSVTKTESATETNMFHQTSDCSLFKFLRLQLPKIHHNTDATH